MKKPLSLEEKLKKSKEQLEQREALKVQKEEEPKRALGRSSLTEGQTNILLAQLIDHLAEGKTTKECFSLINKYYKDTINRNLARSSYYEILARAKGLWLTNFSIPALENYKKEQIIKSDMLEDEVKTKSRRDITFQAQTIKEIWTYKDNLIGLNKDNNNDINIVLGIDVSKSVKAIELDGEE